MSNKHPLRLRKRAEFLAVRQGEKRRGPLFLLEIRHRNDAEKPGPEDPDRFGFTVSKKNGNAVKRNRIKRRLREAVRLRLGRDIGQGTDYVIVARPDLINAPFQKIGDELQHRMKTNNKILKDKTGQN